MFLYHNDLGQLLVLNRDLFLSKQVYQSFCGYAQEQLHRMTNFSSYKGYMGAKRKALVDKYGWDLKNGSHMIRLLRMGVEMLRDGEVNVFRKDAQELIDIKQGKWSLEQVQAEADKLFPEVEEAYRNSKLPESPDVEKINKLCVKILTESLEGN